MYFCSYRDPNLVNTLDVYKKTADYLQNFSCSQTDFEKYIIGTIAEVDMPTTASQKGRESDLEYLMGLNFVDRQSARDEILSTSIEDIRNYSHLIQAVMADNQYCVFGNESKIKENSSLFDKLLPALRI